jgi:3-methyladenine DNA glycosylase AlkC
MAEPFKNLIDRRLLATAGAQLQRAWAQFPLAEFVRLASDGLDRLELKARVLQVAGALEATLPADFDRAAAVLERSLAKATDRAELKGLVAGERGLAGWIIWPLGEFVARRGLPHPERALACLRELTQRLTAEYAIRPFLIEHEALTLRTLRQWCHDPSPHVRRLCSEGSRPRLPWGLRLQRFCADPAPTLPILAALQDDPSDYVRRSVANHLNDIAKDHPAVIARWLGEHLPGAGPQRRALLKHACRTLIKKGDRAVLAAWGLDRPLRGSAALALAPQRVRSGGAVELAVTLRSTAKQVQKLVVDYVVHRVRKDGSTAPKVWKGWTLELAAGETRELVRRHSLQKVTTRTDHPGRHTVELLVNGAVVASDAFELRR